MRRGRIGYGAGRMLFLDTAARLMGKKPPSSGVCPPDLRVLFGERTREGRIARNLSQTQLGELIKTTAAYISRVERGQQNLTLGKMQTIAKALGLTVQDMIALPKPRR